MPNRRTRPFHAGDRRVAWSGVAPGCSPRLAVPHLFSGAGLKPNLIAIADEPLLAILKSSVARSAGEFFGTSSPPAYFDRIVTRPYPIHVVSMTFPDVTVPRLARIVHRPSPRPRIIVLAPSSIYMTEEEAIAVGMFARLVGPPEREAIEAAVARACQPLLARCERVQPLLGAFLRGTLSVPDAFEVREHVETCVGCLEALERAAIQQLKRIGKEGIAWEPTVGT